MLRLSFNWFFDPQAWYGDYYQILGQVGQYKFYFFAEDYIATLSKQINESLVNAWH